MGKGPSSPAPPAASGFQKDLRKYAKELWTTTSPLRTQQLGDWSALAESGYDPRTIPQYGGTYNLARPGLESQYDIAKANVMGNTPQGGGLTSALTNLEQGRAQAVGSLPGQIGTDLLNKELQNRYGVAWNSPSQSMQGLGSAAQSYAQMYGANLQSQAAQNQGKSQMMGSLGMGIGNLLGGTDFGKILGPLMGGSGIGTGMAPASYYAAKSQYGY